MGTLAKDEEVELTKCLRKRMQVQKNMFNDTYTITRTINLSEKQDFLPKTILHMHTTFTTMSTALKRLILA